VLWLSVGRSCYSISSYRSPGRIVFHRFSRVFTVSPHHLNQLEVRRRATVRAVASQPLDLLSNLALSLARSPRFSAIFTRFRDLSHHLNRLRAIRRATLRVVAFRWQESLFDLAPSLARSHRFFTPFCGVSNSSQSTLSYTLGYTSCRCFLSAGDLSGPHWSFIKLALFSVSTSIFIVYGVELTDYALLDPPATIFCVI
jgi:hypothetical protein